MAANIEVEDDTGAAITSFNWGGIQDGSLLQFKFLAKNTGDADAESVIIDNERLLQNDGVDLTLLALDAAGNPGAFSATPLNIGTMIPGQVVAFWVKVTVPTGTTPGGNPRQFNVVVDYTGT